MGILYALIIGLVVGALAKLVTPGRDPGGILVTSVLGLAGSMLAFFIGQNAGWYGQRGDGPGLIASVLGAVVVLVGYRTLVARRVG